MIESKRKAIIFFLLAAILAGTAGFLTLQKVKELNSDLGTMVNVYAANGEIASRSIITPKDIKVEKIPQKFVTPEHITDTKDLENKVSVIPLSSGDLITKNMLKQSSSVLEENNRLITLMSSERVFFDEQLEALDRVDIIVSKRSGQDNKTEIFMKDVKVARVAENDNKFAGVQLEIPLQDAPKLINEQNYADSVRIIKANVGNGDEEKKKKKKKQRLPKQKKKLTRRRRPKQRLKKRRKLKKKQRKKPKKRKRKRKKLKKKRKRRKTKKMSLLKVKGDLI